MRYLPTLLLLFLAKGLFAINPQREYTLRPEQFNLAYREVRVPSGDAELNVWVMRAAAGEARRETVLIAGGDGGNMGYTLAYASQLIALGYDVVTFDYRGFGGSSDFAHDPRAYYHAEYVDDFVAALRFARSEWGDRDTSVLAFSMGTLVAGAGYCRQPFTALVAEGLIVDPARNVARLRELRNRELTLPAGNKDHAACVAALDLPVLVFSALRDPVTTHADADAYAAAAAAGRTLVPYDGEHLRGVATLGFADYFHRVSEFLMRH